MGPRCTAGTLFLSIMLALVLAPQVAIGEQPLLQPGTKTLYERVLTRPGARLARSLVDAGSRNNRLIQAFSRFYVYERDNANGASWLRIGVDTSGRDILGWVAEERTVRWKQQLTLALTNPGTVRDRLLFFKSWSGLKDVLDDRRPSEITHPLIRKIEQGGHDERVVAIEPETFIDINKRFYLLPVLDYVQVLSGFGEAVRALQIASVSLPDPAARAPARPRQAPAPPPQPMAAAQQYRAAVVFVIDSTISMGPYIQETKDAIAQVYQRLRDAEVIDRVGFGLVAFRAETDRSNRNLDLRYVAKQFVDPSQANDARDFLRNVEDLREARVPTQFFDEDAFAGIVEALDKTRWDGFDARYIVLITDAGALDGSAVAGHGPAIESTTGLDARRVASIAGERQVAITVFHLKTPAGAKDHRRAEDQYRELARNSRFQTEAYLPINAGSVRGYRRAVDTLADAIIANVGQQEAVTPQEKAIASPHRGRAAMTEDETEQDIREIANALGHAMRLAYLGKVEDTRAPTLFEAWISDHDFADPTKRTVEVRVLLTKNQLSDLQMILQKIVNASDRGMLKPDRFFDSLRSLAAQFTRDPNLAKRKKATRLADLGLLAEYLNGLPYQSEVMELTQETWTAWGPQKQVGFVNQLKRKLRQYARYNEDWENWVNLAQTVDASGDFVYPVPLEDMP